MGARGPSVVIVAPEPVRADSSGPARRAAKLAEVVGEQCPVTLAAPAPSEFPAGPFTGIETGPIDRQRLAPLLAEHEVAVVQALPSPRQLLIALRHSRRLVVDLIAPLGFETAHAPGKTPAQRRAMAAWRVRQLIDHLRVADLVLCTNERQRDLLIGASMAALGPAPDAERFVVVPHGIDENPPRAGGRPLRDAGVVGAEDRLAVWGGGMWGWLDPLTPIMAVERLRARHPELRLVFAGTGRDRGDRGRAVDEAVAYARDRGLEGGPVIFVHDWLDRSVYLDHLLEADAGVAAHPATLEARYATRTRVLDYLWAGLPVACTRGDVMAELVEANALGAAADPGDVDAFADALERVLFGDLAGPRDRAALEPLFWRNAARPLADYCAAPGDATRRPRPSAVTRTVGQYPSFLRWVYHDAGARGIARAAARRLNRSGRSG